MVRRWSLFSLFVTAVAGLYSCGNQPVKQPTTGAYAAPEVAAVSARIEKDPQNAALYFDRAKIFHEMGEDSLSLKDIQSALGFDSTKAHYFSAAGELLFEHKDVEGSIRYFKKAIQLDPGDPVAHLKYAKLLMFVDKNQDAFNEINTVLRRDPYNGEAYFLKGMVYKNLKDTAKALSSFQTSIQVDPNYQASFLQLGSLYAAKKDSIALRYFENAYRADTSDMIGLYSEGMYYQDNGLYEKAKQTYRRIIMKQPQFADAFFNTGWILMRQDSFEKAARQFDLVTKIEPANSGAYYNRGVCYELMNKKQEALSDYNQALELDPEYAEAKAALSRLGRVK